MAPETTETTETTETAETAETAEATEAAEAAEAATLSDEADGAAAKRPARRRRPRASKPETTEAPAEAATPPGEADEAPPTPTTRRRRSRASKPSAGEAPAEGGGEDSADDVPAEEAPAPPAPASPAPRRRTSDALNAVEARLERLERLADEIASQRSAILQLGASVDELAVRLDRAARKPRLGVFVDVPNVLYGLDAGAAPLDMGKLLAMLSEGRELVRATAYAPVSDDQREAVEQQKFVAPFVRHAYRIVTKPLKRFADGSVKGNFDVEMAIDLVTMSERLDVVAVVSGDSDFARAVEMVQSRGVRAEVVAFAGSTSIEMRALADHYVELDRFAAQLR